MTPICRTILIAALGIFVVSAAVLLVSSANAVLSSDLIAGGELVTGDDGDRIKGTLSEHGAKVALGNNANAVLSLDLIASGGAGNQRDDGVTTGTVSGQGTTIAIEVFATGVRTSLIGFQIEFDLDPSFVALVRAEDSFIPQLGPINNNSAITFASLTARSLSTSGFVARAEFETIADVTGREFAIGIARVRLGGSDFVTDSLTTTSVITFNATPSPDFDGDGTVGFSDFVAFVSNYGTQRGDAAFDTRFDLDGDGETGFSDFVAFVSQYGTTVGSAPPSGSPDLIVESPSVNDNTLTTGQSFTLGATVRNQGNASAAATTLRYYRSSNATVSSDDVEVGTDAVSSLSAGGTSAESISLNAPSGAGTYYYGACVDNVSGESNTGNNCSAARRVTVTQTTPSGFAPADQSAFNRLAVGKRILLESFFVDVVSAGRFTEGLRRHDGRYTYSNTGANAGRFTQVYDDSELFGGTCTSQLTFTSATTGTADIACDDGTEIEGHSWRISDLATPVFVRASSDTLHFGILATWRAGQTRAYDLQLRKKTPQGGWNDVCVRFTNRSDDTLTAYAGPWIYSSNLEPNTAYEFRYRYRNSSSCQTGSPDPWSPIVDGTTPGSGTGGGDGGGTGSLGTCRAGLVVCPQGNCVHPNGTRFSVDASGRGTFGNMSAGTGISISSANLTFVAEKRSDNCWIVREAR